MQPRTEEQPNGFQCPFHQDLYSRRQVKKAILGTITKLASFDYHVDLYIQTWFRNNKPMYPKGMLTYSTVTTKAKSMIGDHGVLLGRCMSKHEDWRTVYTHEELTKAIRDVCEPFYCDEQNLKLDRMLMRPHMYAHFLLWLQMNPPRYVASSIFLFQVNWT